MRQTLIALAAAVLMGLVLTPAEALADHSSGCNVYGCYEAGGGCNVYGCFEAGGGCNVYGCWDRRGGCNIYGCWSRGGGCNVYGCWNSRGGACNVYGCSDAGECSVYGCPADDERRRRHHRRWRHSSLAPTRIPRIVAVRAKPTLIAAGRQQSSGASHRSLGR